METDVLPQPFKKYSYWTAPFDYPLQRAEIAVFVDLCPSKDIYTSAAWIDMKRNKFIINYDMVPEVKELEELRKKLGLSQAELSGQLDIGHPTYQDWIYHDVKPSYDNLKKIMKYLEKHENSENAK